MIVFDTPVCSAVRPGVVAALACMIGLGTKAARAQDPAREELRAAIETGMNLASGINGNAAMFRAAVAPDGPLDLRVQSVDVPPRSIHGMREYFFGAVGQAAGVDPLVLIKAFESCACDTARRDSAVAVLASARVVARAMSALHGARVIAAWPGGWAVDTLAYDGTAFVMRQPSPVLGLLPWQARPVTREQAEKSLSNVGASVDAVTRIVSTMTEHGLASAARDTDGDVRVTRAGGMASDATGLIFVASNNTPPTVGAIGRAGDRYVTVTAVAPGVYFYETH
jgi:hypothetical protein